MECNEAQVLVSGYLDRELTQQDAQRVRNHLESCDKCSKAHAEMKLLKERMGGLTYPDTDRETLAALEKDMLSQVGQWSGWLLVALGILVIMGFGMYTYLTSPDLHGLVKFMYVALHLGLAILFIVVLRQRLKTYRNDKYRKVKL